MGLVNSNLPSTLTRLYVPDTAHFSYHSYRKPSRKVLGFRISVARPKRGTVSPFRSRIRLLKVSTPTTVLTLKMLNRSNIA